MKVHNYIVSNFKFWSSMKSGYSWIFPAGILLLIFLLYSCEDVITINLNNASPKLVIEGNISNRSDSVIVQLSQTTDYFNPSQNSTVSGARISVTDNENHSYVLEELKPGYYGYGKITASPGTGFKLEVNSNNIDYQADSNMPQLVVIDSLAIEKPSGKQVQGNILCYAKDPKGIDNYYHIRVLLNDSLLNPSNRFLLFNDKYFDGNATTFSIGMRRLGVDKFKSNDTVTVQLISIDKKTYEYYRTLRDITNQEQILSVSTPANPPNNISNGALGYFSAWSVSERKIIVK